MKKSWSPAHELSEKNKDSVRSWAGGICVMFWPRIWPNHSDCSETFYCSENLGEVWIKDNRLIHMAEEIPKQENIQADAKKVSTTKKRFPMLHQDNRKHVPGPNSTPQRSIL